MRHLFARRRHNADFSLVHLWDNWPFVMGPALAPLAHPLGAREATLIVGAEDNLILYELHFQAEEILARANAFLCKPYFSRLRLELMGERASLHRLESYERPPEQAPALRLRPDKLGSLADKVDPESVFGRAYLTYLRSFEP